MRLTLGIGIIFWILSQTLRDVPLQQGVEKNQKERGKYLENDEFL